tara:strand:+ start:283 stop:726 length:444 start_codon:yes stop_codon:yes gene_type:complete
MALLIGRDARAYYSATPLSSEPTGAPSDEALNIMDLTLDIESELTDTTTRAEARNGWRAEVAVLRNGRVSFDIRWDSGDAFTAALIDAWNTFTPIQMGFFDQNASTTGAQGLVANFSVSISKSEALTDVQKASVSLTVHSYPKWLES